MIGVRQGRARVIKTGGNSMRILLRDKITGHYFAGDESWTEELEEAQSFPTGAHALSKAWRSGFKNMLAVYWFGSAAESFVLPIPAISKLYF